MIAGILKETASENRVSILPEQVDILRKMNVETGVEESAGERAFATDNAYIQKNAIIAERKKILQTSDILLSIHRSTCRRPRMAAARVELRPARCSVRRSIC